MLLGRDGYEIIPDKKEKPVNIVAKSSAGTPSAARSLNRRRRAVLDGSGQR